MSSNSQHCTKQIVQNATMCDHFFSAFPQNTGPNSIESAELCPTLALQRFRAVELVSGVDYPGVRVKILNFVENYKRLLFSSMPDCGEVQDNYTERRKKQRKQNKRKQLSFSDRLNRVFCNFLHLNFSNEMVKCADVSMFGLPKYTKN